MKQDRLIFNLTCYEWNWLALHVKAMKYLRTVWGTQHAFYMKITEKIQRNCRSFLTQCNCNSKREHWRRPRGLSWKCSRNWGRQEPRIPADTQARQAREWQWRWRTNDCCTFPEIFGQKRSIQARAQTTNYRLFEDIPKEFNQKRKFQMGRLKEARK